jgi:DNA-binding GntR family transcriptional regulator
MPVPRSGKKVDCDHGLRRQAIVQSLLIDIFGGRLAAGQHLVTQALAERFGVSHTPVREALIALAGLSLVDLLPNRGATVRAVTARDVREICEVRRILECQATRSACSRIDLTELNRLAQDLRTLIAQPLEAITNFQEARRLDTCLHDLVCHSCGNTFLTRELARLKILFRAFRDNSYTYHETRKDFRRLAEEAVEHLAVVEALQAGDAKAASQAMARHIRQGIRYWTSAVARQTRPASPQPDSEVPSRSRR